MQHPYVSRLVAAQIAILALSAGLLGAPAPARADQVYNYPQVYGLSVDNCAVWGTNCGWGGAHQFCQAQGYPGARSFQMYRPGRTYVIGARATCTGSFCVGFSQVVCASAAQVSPPAPPAAQVGSVNVAGRWQWAVNCPEPNGGLFDIGPIAADGSFTGAFHNGNGTFSGRVLGNRMEFVRTWGGNQQQRWSAFVSSSRMDQGAVQRPTEGKGNCSFNAYRV
ncbi:MAG: hypothetical protein AB7P21_30360 [Lautropia sp.]